MNDQEFALQDYYDNLENDWIKSQPNYTDSGWIEIFPECGPIIKRETRRQIKEINTKQQELVKASIDLKNQLSTIPATDHYFIERAIKLRQELFDKLDKQIRYKQWLLNKLNGAPQNPDKIGPDDIQRAKDVPVSNFIQAKKAGRLLVASCPWHSDSTPSFTIYPNNTWHCFGCNEGGDVIDYIQKLHTMQFLEAVRWLINK